MDMLYELLKESDFVVVTLPWTPETDKIIDKKVFQNMKKDAVFINIGRGKLVNDEDLIEALKTNAILGAALDVFSVEPLPESSPYWELDNCFVTSHNMDHIVDIKLECIQLFNKNCEKFLKEEELLNIVDKSAGY